MPLDALVELAAYQDLLLGVAKELFKADNPDRQRVPRGFADRLQLRLRTVEEGSAMPVLERLPQEGEFVAVADEFTKARDTIEDAVDAVASGADVPEAFPSGSLVLFNRFGQTLRPDEAIELRRGDATAGPKYTRDIRKRLVLLQRRTFQEEVADFGWVSELDADHMSCLIRLRMGPSSPVPAPLDEMTFAAAKEGLEPKGEGPPVRISGLGVFDSEQSLIRFDSIHDVSVLDEPDDLARIDGRLNEISALSPGWLDGGGEAVGAKAVETARRLLAELLAHDVPHPRVFPTPEGGVQAEWTIDDREISVTFESDGSLYAISVHLESGDADEPELSPDNAEAIARLLSRE